MATLYEGICWVPTGMKKQIPRARSKALGMTMCLQDVYFFRNFPLLLQELSLTSSDFF
jgi:hypothetical protein